MKETRTLYSEDLRNLCIRKNWYTRGNNEEYTHLLCKVDNCAVENITTEIIVELARDILEHSDTDHPLSSVCFEIAEICHSFFE